MLSLRRSLVNGLRRRTFCDTAGAKTSATTAQKSFMRRGPISWTSFGLCCTVVVSAVIFFEIEKDNNRKTCESTVTTVGKAALGGPFVLVDAADGLPVTDSKYRGDFLLLYFGFTHCPDICPNELVKLGKLIDNLDKRKMPQIKPVFISVDPQRDTVGQMRHYGVDFHPSLDWLTGTKQQLAAVTRAYRVYFSKANEVEEDDDDYLVDHSIVMYLVSPSGEFLDFYGQKMLVNDIADKIQGKIKDYFVEQRNNTSSGDDKKIKSK